MERIHNTSARRILWNKAASSLIYSVLCVSLHNSTLGTYYIVPAVYINVLFVPAESPLRRNNFVSADEHTDTSNARRRFKAIPEVRAVFCGTRRCKNPFLREGDAVFLGPRERRATAVTQLGGAAVKDAPSPRGF